jgi:LacI family transcriptional regulator
MKKTDRTSNHVTILDVARVSGFSPSTVSIVLNEAPLSKNVAAKTKEHIRATAQSLGYRPDASARSLRSRRSHTIGVMIFDFSDPFCIQILRGIELSLDPTPFLPIIMDAHNDRKQFERYLEMMLERRVEGLIVVANWLFAEIELLPDFGRGKIPTVVVGRDLSASISSVIVDNEAGGYAAMQHLYELGHRRIAFIRGPRQLQDSARRWQGIRRFAKDAGLVIDMSLVKQLTASSDPISGFAGGRALTTELIEQGNRFTAILAFDDLTGLGAIRSLYEAGLSVPGDCSVIGFDDVPLSALATPGLTTIRQPMGEMGGVATAWILENLQEGEDAARPPACRLMTPVLVWRSSTQSIRAR